MKTINGVAGALCFGNALRETANKSVIRPVEEFNLAVEIRGCELGDFVNIKIETMM